MTTPPTPMPRLPVSAVLLCVFTVSGFSGLIYESIWSHYLKLFLGHAAYSQTLVLTIFMGGLALGSALAAHWSTRWRSVLLGYAVVEGATGVAALLFHQVFDSVTEYSFTTIIPALPPGFTVQAYKWSLAALLILPQSTLLGMTFPLMSAGFLRHTSSHAGGNIALLYFTNSFGGALGVLGSGFVLIPWVGLPGTMLAAGVLNVMVALATWLVARRLDDAMPPQSGATAAENAAPATAGYRLLLVASLVTGLASFCYEIGWIRMLSLVLGATTHAFELMLSSFILGLAFGGLWIRKRMERLQDPRVLLGVVQVAMALLALATLFVYGRSFDWMGTVLHTFARTGEGYVGFNVSSHLITSVVMVPATFCAGMTLPLITYTALRVGVGERAIGGIYAANTVGGILGVVLAVHVLLPAVGANGAVVVGALFDFGLGVALLRGTAVPRRVVPAVLAVGAAAFGLAITAGETDVTRLTSGVFRTGVSRLGGHQVTYLRDGATANVALFRSGEVMKIATNGKVDGSVNMGSGPGTLDELNQSMSGALPIALHPGARTAAVVGIGTGMTSQVLLAYPQLTRVDTIEIEPRMLEAARQGFFPRNQLVYQDPRSHLHVEDAKTFFSVAGRRYDIIVNEPSNPWVSGVASLFTSEFYRNTARHLEPGGLLVQWFQIYEIDVEILASIVTALSPNFSDYAIYMVDGSNVHIAARKDGPVGELGAHLFSPPLLAAELERVGLRTVDDLQLRFVGDKRLLDPLMVNIGAPVNSDYFPYVDNNAARTRYLGLNARPVAMLNDEGPPLRDFLAPQGPRPARRLQATPGHPSSLAVLQDILAHLDNPRGHPAPEDWGQDLAILRWGMEACDRAPAAAWPAAWVRLGRLVSRHLGAEDALALWDRVVPVSCLERLPPVAGQWRALFLALSRRDVGEVIAQGRLLLKDATPDWPPDETIFVAQATMVAHLARHEPARALEVLAALRTRLRPGTQLPLELRWLATLAAPPP